MKYYIQFFLCGIFTSFLFPPFFLIPIGFVVFPYLFFLLNQKKFIKLAFPHHLICGFFYGIGFMFIFLGWIKEPFLLDENTKKLYFFSYLLIFYSSFYFAFVFFILKYFHIPILKLFMIPTLIVLFEYICGHLSYGFPWLSFALVNSGNFFGPYIIYYIGTYGLSYITILIFLFPSILIIQNIKHKKILAIVILFFLITLTFLIGFRNKEINSLDNKSISVTIVQLNLPMNQQLSNFELKNKSKLILDIIKKNKSDLIVFSENNYPYLINDSNIKIIQQFLNFNSNIIIGGTRKENDKFYNSLFLINNNSYQKFDKQILVPFGEFIPLRSFFGFMKFIAGTNDYSIGKDTRLIKINDKINFIPVICYEIIYFWRLINSNNNKANFIVNITNDSWFGRFSGPYQHFYFTRLRAAEFNKNLIRVSNNGISAYIDSSGKINNFINLDTQKIQTINIKISDSYKNYLKFHRLIFFLIFLSLVIGFFINKKNDT